MSAAGERVKQCVPEDERDLALSVGALASGKGLFVLGRGPRIALSRWFLRSISVRIRYVSIPVGSTVQSQPRFQRF